MKRNLIHYFGLLGLVSFLSYAVAVIFSPLAYPGYDWKAQAVSDLSAANAPSLKLWNQLTVLYVTPGIVSIMVVCVYVQDKLNATTRGGIYLFALMNWISYVGYALFPLTDSGLSDTFQDTRHIIVTILVVLTSIVSMLLIIRGGFLPQGKRSLSYWAASALTLMFVGAIGVGIVPPAYFGVVERFSVFAVTGFNAILGIYLYNNVPKT